MSLWQECVRTLEHQFKEEDINAWVRPLKVFESAGSLNLVAPNNSIATWVKKNCLSKIQEALNTSAKAPVTLLLSINAQELAEPEEHLKNQQRITTPPESKLTSFLNPRQTFDSFVEGKSNQIAKAAAQQIAADPGKTANPFFLYSGVGLGKTHLIHAIGNEIVRNNPDTRVLYMSSERFVHDMVRALRENKMEKFKHFYRSVEVLLVDDVQFFAGKEQSQEEFFHTFNTLFQSQRQIIMTCDRYPKDIIGLQERLKSRFGWGLTQSIEAPDLETRVAIVQNKAASLGMPFSEDIAFFIAKNIDSNIRELEGAVRRVKASAHALHVPVTVELVKDTLRDAFVSHCRAVTIEDVQKVTAEYYNVRVADLLSKSRKKVFTFPRQMAMAIAKEVTISSLPTIGDAFGGRDHTTVIYACKKIEGYRQTDVNVDNAFKRLLQELNG